MTSRKIRIHPRIQVALATGVSIIALAYFSKKVLPEPLGYLELAFPPFLATVFETVVKRRPSAWYSRPACGVAAVLLATALMILLNMDA